jgi:hypothetical protein
VPIFNSIAAGLFRGGDDFGEGRLDPERAAKVPAKQVGRMLTRPSGGTASGAANSLFTRRV